jgi:hypothetical protein
MAFIGNTPQNQGFTPAIDYFNGDGTTVTFTLSRPVVSVAQMIVAIDNVIQNPSSAFTVSGNSITFTSAPLSGTNNIWVEYTSLITQYNAISQDPSVIGDITASGGYLATGDFGNTFTDGTIVDYVTGMARITTGDADGITLYNNGPSARNALMTLASTGNVGIRTTSPSGVGTLAVKTISTSEGAGLAVISSANDSFLAIYNSGSVHNIGATYSSTGSYQPIAFVTSGSERMRINTGAPILCLAGGNTSATGTGIAFPGTQSSSSDANTLDDYEEGQYTPIVSTGITSPTYSSQSGYYTKIGDVVTFALRIAVNGGARNSTILSFALPFVAKNTGFLTGGASWGYVNSNVIGSTTTNLPTLYISTNESRIYCYKTTPDSFIGTDLVGVGIDVYIGGSYLTAT